MNIQRAARQRFRQALMITSFLLFPITINYFSPYLIIFGASQGIINGSFIVFGLMFFFSLFVGRLWCAWACPAGGLGEICFPVNDRRLPNRRINWIKWAIWVPWLGLIAWAAIYAGGYHAVDFTLGTENGISVAGSPDRSIIFAYIIYYGVILIFALLSVLAGRRAGCRTICWMAPFMMLGRWMRNLAGWPALRLKADQSACTDCQKCTTGCPMSLEVNAMVRRGRMEDSECILCGRCVDGCPQKVIRYSFSKGNN